MPIYERDGQKIHFVHIPKTGGMSIRHMFKASGWTDLHEGHNNKISVKPGKLYHDHMPYSWWKDWEVASQCDFEFAVSRNPITRMTSLVHMWLRSFWLEAHSAAWKKGGNIGQPMRELLVEMKALKPNASEEEFELRMGSITYPADLHDRQKIANLNDMTLEYYETLINDNIFAMFKKCAEMNIKSLHGKYLPNCSWIDLVEIYMKTERFDNIERTSLTPLPCHKYVSDKTHVYKFEDFTGMLNDLVSRGLLEPESISIKENSWGKLVNITNPSRWSDSEDTRSRFYELYDKDFEIFEYDKNTPFPGQNLWSIRSHPMGAIYASD